MSRTERYPPKSDTSRERKQRPTTKFSLNESMEESEGILVNSLKSFGIQIPPEISSIADINPTTLYSISTQSLARLLPQTPSFPPSLPDYMPDRVRICTRVASALTDLGFLGDASFHKFLYPSEDDLYKLVRFLVQRLSEAPQIAESPDEANNSEVCSETEAVLSEIRIREEVCAKLEVEFEKQPKVASRRSYVERITEITKNSRKQNADIERILKETRDLQLESNSIEERLHRSYAVVDEMVFREAKKDMVGRQAYRLLTNIHDSFEEIRSKILETDRTRREVGDIEAKLAIIATRSLDMEKLQADLDAIKRENESLERKLHAPL